MSPTARDATPSPWERRDLELWRWQLQTLEDLLEFVTEHGPSSTAPLPVQPWEIRGNRRLGVDLPGDEPGTLTVLFLYAHALKTTVRTRRRADEVIFSVDGHIGEPDGSDDVPRTTLQLRTSVFLDNSEGKRLRGPAHGTAEADGTAGR